MAFYQNIQSSAYFSGGASDPIVLAGTADPTAGGGVTAPEGSLYLRFVAGAGEVWTKTGALATAWVLGTNVWVDTGTFLRPVNNGRGIQMDTGGNARGDDAVDFQQSRTLATQVASGDRSAILAGQNNTVSNFDAVASGANNLCSAERGAVLGGDGNSASANDAATLGGTGNSVDSPACVALGGDTNSVGGGGSFGGAVGGQGNTVTGTSAGTLGGETNQATGVRSAIVGGELNEATSQNVGILGGQANIVSGQMAATAGGTSNVVGGDNAAALGGSTHVVGGDRSVALGGLGSTTASDDSTVMGSASRSELTGQRAVANGSFALAGDAQGCEVVARVVTADATPTALTLDGGALAAVNALRLRDNASWTVEVKVIGRRVGVAVESAGYILRCVIQRGVGVATTALVGVVDKVVLGESDATWDATLLADVVNGALEVRVTGAAGKTIRWVGYVTWAESLEA